MSKETEALKLALDALESGKNHGVAIDVLRRVLAEQPAQQQEPVAWTTWRELVGARHYGTPGWEMYANKRNIDDVPLYTSPQPAQQQEPVATDWERIARVQDAKLRAMCNEPGGFEKLCEVMDRYERTSPPASKPLTDKQIDKLDCVYALWDDGESCTIMGIKDFAKAIEAAHGIKGDA